MSEFKKITTASFQKLKENGEKIAATTAYDYSSAKFIDEAGTEMILVGDSLAMVALGYETTHSVGIDEMLIFTKAVAKGVKRAFVCGDMPFLSYQTSIKDAVKNAGQMIKAGASGVKIEGGNDYILKVVKRCVEGGIPVLGHLGFTPQFLNTMGGYKIQGKSYGATLDILEQAKKLEKAGVFAIVLEMVPEESAKYITENLTVPTLGIGAGRFCSGQILVSDDILGKYSDFTPKFARKYLNLKENITNGMKNYISDIKTDNFPSEEEVFHLPQEELKQLELRTQEYVNYQN